MWVARDLSGDLYAYQKKPLKGEKQFISQYHSECCKVLPILYMWLTFNNSPYEVMCDYHIYCRNYGFFSKY